MRFITCMFYERSWNAKPNIVVHSGLCWKDRVLYIKRFRTGTHASFPPHSSVVYNDLFAHTVDVPLDLTLFRRSSLFALKKKALGVVKIFERSTGRFLFIFSVFHIIFMLVFMILTGLTEFRVFGWTSAIIATIRVLVSS